MDVLSVLKEVHNTNHVEKLDNEYSILDCLHHYRIVQLNRHFWKKIFEK